MPTSEAPPSEDAGQGPVDKQLARNGGLSYLEIPTLDIEASATFYENVIGWRVHGDGPDHRSKFMDQSGHLLGRWIKGRTVQRKPGLLPYIYVDHLHEAVSRVADFKGEVTKPPFEEGNLFIAIIGDPSGNALGLWRQR